MQELPGRIWEGKEVMLTAAAALCKAVPKEVMGAQQEAYSSTAVVAALMAALSRKKQSYR